MIDFDIAAAVREQVADDLAIVRPSPDRLEVSTRFTYLDGDRFSCVFLRNERGRWIVTDDGDVITRAGYAGIDLLAGGRRERFERTASFYGVTESSGALTLPVSTASDFGKAFFTFSQACFEISRLVTVPAERHVAPKAKRNFQIKLASIIEAAVPSSRRTGNWHHPDLDPHGIYGVTYRIEGRDGPLLVFGAGSDMECLRAALSAMHYRQLQFPFMGIAVNDDSKALSAHSLTALDDAVETRFAASESQELEEFLAAA